MNERGYLAVITRGFTETISVIDEYLSKDKTRAI